LTSKNLADAIIESFDPMIRNEQNNSSKCVAFSMEFLVPAVALKAALETIQKWEKGGCWQKNSTVTNAKVQMQDNNGADWLFVAVRENDLQTVNKILALGHEISNIWHPCLSPLNVALVLKYQEIIQIIFYYMARHENPIELFKNYDPYYIIRLIDYFFSHLKINELFILLKILKKIDDQQPNRKIRKEIILLAIENISSISPLLLLTAEVDPFFVPENKPSIFLRAAQLENIIVISACLNIPTCQAPIDQVLNALLMCQSPEIKKILIDFVFTIQKHIPNKLDPLMQAIRNNNIQVVQALIEPNLINDKWLGVITPLELAAQLGYSEIITLFEQTKFNNICLNQYLNHAVCIALKRNLASCEELFELQKDPLSTAFIFKQALAAGHNEMVKRLITYNSGLLTEEIQGDRVLFKAIQLGYLDIAITLLRASQAIDGELVEMLVAVLVRDIAICDHLLEQGLNINAATHDRINAIHLAVLNKDWLMVNYLANRGANLYVQCDFGVDPLTLAYKNNDYNMAYTLYAHGLDFDDTFDQAYGFILHMLKNKNIFQLESFMELGINLNSLSKSQLNEIIFTAIDQGLDAVRALLRQAVDLSDLVRSGYNPLMWAMLKEEKEIVRLLLSYNANPLEVNKDNMNALHFAVQMGHLDFVKLLISTFHGHNLLNRTFPIAYKVLLEFSHEQGVGEEFIGFIRKTNNGLPHKEILNFSVLHLAIFTRNKTIIHLLLNKKTFWPTDQLGNSAHQYAIILNNGSREIIEKFYQAKFYKWFAKERRYKVRRLYQYINRESLMLAEFKPIFSLYNDYMDGLNPLACILKVDLPENEQAILMKRILAQGINPNAYFWNKGDSVLDKALMLHKISLIELLLIHGAKFKGKYSISFKSIQTWLTGCKVNSQAVQICLDKLFSGQPKAEVYQINIINLAVIYGREPLLNIILNNPNYLDRPSLQQCLTAIEIAKLIKGPKNILKMLNKYSCVHKEKFDNLNCLSFPSFFDSIHRHKSPTDRELQDASQQKTPCYLG
jgi:ankyrin repeat protein